MNKKCVLLCMLYVGGFQLPPNRVGELRSGLPTESGSFAPASQPSRGASLRPPNRVGGFQPPPAFFYANLEMVKKAVLVGINYRKTSAELRGCINDVYNVEMLLREYWGFTEIRILTDDTEIKPTKKGIMEALAWLVSSAPEDTLFFHYSGHGTLVKDHSGDEESGKDSALVPIDYTTSGVILDDELRATLDLLPPKTRFFGILDCCHSGTGFDLHYLYSDSSYTTASPAAKIDLSSKYRFDLFDLKQSVTELRRHKKTAANVVLLSGCRDDQTAADAFEESQNCGALTYAFIKCCRLSSGRPKWKYLLKDVSCLLHLKKYTQIPQLSSGCSLPMDDELFL